MNPIAVFYHCLFLMGKPPVMLPLASSVVSSQMRMLKSSGLLNYVDEFYVGVNGGEESRILAESYIPKKAAITYHGLDSRSENLTIAMVEKWAKSHPNWDILYFHSKGATHKPPAAAGYEMISEGWRNDMMFDAVSNWTKCVSDLESGYDIACSLWLKHMADGTQNIPAGNFLWVKSDFVAKLPSIFLRDRIKQDGIGALSSRWEAEVYWGNGPEPRVKSYRQSGWPWNRR